MSTSLSYFVAAAIVLATLLVGLRWDTRIARLERMDEPEEEWPETRWL